MSIFIGAAPEIVNIISILAAIAEGLQNDQALWWDNAEGAAFSVHFEPALPHLLRLRSCDEEVQNELFSWNRIDLAQPVDPNLAVMESLW
jgi:hypothetical protein